MTREERHAIILQVRAVAARAEASLDDVVAARCIDANDDAGSRVLTRAVAEQANALAALAAVVEKLVDGAP